MIDLDELRKLAEAATPGPWETRYDGYEDVDADDIISGELEDDELPEEITVGAGSYLKSPGYYVSSDLILEYDTSSHSAGDFHFPVANAEFIAAVNPQVILALIERVRRVEAERDAALARIAEAAKLHRRDSPGLGGEWCQSDGLKWPCPTAVALGLNEGENE